MYRNQSVYSTRSALKVYANMPEITPAERLIFAQAQARIEIGPVLDIGVGAGRTTASLATLCDKYYGVDYSPAMIAHCRARFAGNPALEFILADAASMPMLASASFPFILFSFNGIDSVAHAHRLRILREIRRLLAPGGCFAFSAHNRAYRDIQRTPRFRRPWRLRGIARTGVEIANHIRVRRQAYACTEYELINDPPHLFSILTYYIGRKAQIAQLEAEGFHVLSVIDADGRVISDGDDETLSPNFHYLTEA
jgi:SAM-dependent methyltransferase